MPYQIPGATAVGITFDNGIVLGAEKRVSYGTHLVSRSGKKVFKVTDKVGAAAAGMIADMNILMREVSCLLYTSPSPRDATLSRMPSSA